MQVITIQVQLEPDLGLSSEALGEIRGDMMTLALNIEKWGYVRAEMFINQEAYKG